MLTMQERRRFPRYPIGLSAVLTHGKNTSYGLQTGDISAGGIFVLTPHPPGLRQLVTVGIQLPDGRSFESHAMVVWRLTEPEPGGRAPGFGLQFYALHSDARAMWEKFMKDVRQFVDAAREQGDLAEVAAELPGDHHR